MTQQTHGSSSIRPDISDPRVSSSTASSAVPPTWEHTFAGMSLPPPPEAVLAEDEDYNSEDDSDFDPEAAPLADDVDLSSTEDDGDDTDSTGETEKRPKDKQRTRKRKRTNSNDDLGGEGGLIKTRAQRALEQREKIGGVGEGKVTTNVDDLWAQMNAAPIRKPASATEASPEKSADEGKKAKEVTEESTKEVLSSTGERMVAIKTTYEFAGETITEEKLVPAASFTARAHQSTASNTPSPGSSSDPSAPRRRVPKKRASVFDAAAASRAKPTAPTKLNTLEKSRLDWAGFVDKEGIGDELQKWNKGDKGYLERQAFLGRVDENRDQQWKAANKKR